MQDALLATLEAARTTGSPKVRALVGFDGFVDTIVRAVDKRDDFDHYTPIATMTDFGQRIVRAAGLSTNIELVPSTVKLGGNAPIMSQAMVTLGVDVTCVGSLGRDAIHPVFQGIAARCTTYSLADPGRTIAVEFADGKVMLNQTESFKEVTWDALVAAMGLPRLVQALSSSDLIAWVNWTMLPHMTQIWNTIIDQVLPTLPVRDPKPWLFIDLADPEKRKSEEIAHALNTLRLFRTHFRTVLGLNRKEATEVSNALGLKLGTPAKDAALSVIVPALAERLKLDGVVVHPTDQAAGAFGSEFTLVPGPHTQSPVLTTGAGDNFNAGLCTGLMLGLTPQESMLLGKATSGFYVRHGRSPSWSELLEFLSVWAQNVGSPF